MLGKGLGYCQIPVRELNDLRCLFLKVKLNFAPFTVAICLIQVGCGGDFLFPFLLRFVFQLDPKKTTVEELGLYMAGAKKEAKER